MLSSMEKYQKMLSLEPYSDRREIPVYPQMITTFGALAGMTQAEVYDDIDAWIQAVEKTAQVVGHFDVCMANGPSDAVFGMALRAKVPGRELPEDELYQFIETPYFDDPDEYQKIMQMGWENWYMQYICTVQTPPFTSPEQLGARFMRMGQNMGKAIGYLYSHGMVPGYHTAVYPIYDMLSLIRSMEEFTLDLCDDPGPIMDILAKYQPIDDEAVIGRLKQNNGSSVCIYAMRSSATFASPDMYDEYIWPHLSASIRRYWEAGIMSVVHADGNWLPMLDRFTQLPRGCCHIELDGATDIQAAYDILQGSQSIRGDVPSTMFAYDSVEAVQEYCEKLVNMGMKGGFMLGSGCEVPLNCKPENVKAMIDAVR